MWVFKNGKMAPIVVNLKIFGMTVLVFLNVLQMIILTRTVDKDTRGKLMDLAGIRITNMVTKKKVILSLTHKLAMVSKLSQMEPNTKVSFLNLRSKD